jgi:hypothetical protein
MPCFAACKPEFARWCAAACVAMCLGSSLAHAQTPAPVTAPAATSALTLETLLAKFAAMSGLSAKFREEKRMALLAAPLVNEGVLYFAPKGRLARHITAPAPATVLIDEGTLRYADAGGSETLSLDSNPVLRLFIDSFVKIFAGDREALARMYTLELTASAGDRWVLRLRPRIAPITQIIERIEITGHDVTLETMRVIEIGGDETVTTFTEVDPRRRFTAAEMSSLFRLPGQR